MIDEHQIDDEKPLRPRGRWRYPWAMLVVILLFVVVPFLSWYGTWFGRPLSDKAMAEYQQILKSDPKHMATLHNLVIVHMEARDFAAAEQVLKQMEQIDPKYEGLEPLRKRLSELSGK